MLVFLVRGVVQQIKNSVKLPSYILDIDTGLLSLMIAQETTSFIDAIEIDPLAAQEARNNFQQSHWGNRLQVLQGDVLQYCFKNIYNIIVSNPPFFYRHLKSQHITTCHVSQRY